MIIIHLKQTEDLAEVKQEAFIINDFFSSYFSKAKIRDKIHKLSDHTYLNYIIKPV